MRARNLGNIGYFHQHMAGLIGPSNSRDVDHSIALFATQEDGIRAAANLALHKYQQGRHSTWDLIAAKGGWTPGALGPGASVNIARMVGAKMRPLDLDDPSGSMHKFLRGLAMQEHGKAAASTGPYDRSGAQPSLSAYRFRPRRAARQKLTSTRNVHLDGKIVARNTTRHQVTQGRFPTAVGGIDAFGSFSSPSTPLGRRRTTDDSNLQPLVEAITKAVDRAAKEGGHNLLEVCGALGAAAGAVVGVNMPDPAFDVFMLGAIGMGFEEIVKGARATKANET